MRRFWKPKSRHIATVEAEPGKTTLRLTRNGEVVATVVLLSLERGMRETKAIFVDPSHFLLENRRLR